MASITVAWDILPPALTTSLAAWRPDSASGVVTTMPLRNRLRQPPLETSAAPRGGPLMTPNPAWRQLGRVPNSCHASRIFVVCSGGGGRHPVIANNAKDARKHAKALVISRRSSGRGMVLPDRIELSTSPLPMECSTTELRQRAHTGESISCAPLKRGDPCHIDCCLASAARDSRASF